MIKKQVARWNNWRNISTNRQIFAGMLVVMVMTVVVNVIAAAKELVVANYFGTGEVVGAFLIALLLPMFAINVLAGSFSAAMMPIYIRTRDTKGKVAAKQLFSSVMAQVTLFLMIVVAILAALAPQLLPILGSGFNAQTLALTQTLFYWLLPILLLTGVGRLYATVINAGERFALVALAPIITPTCSIIFILLLINKWGIYTLVIGAVIGAVIELAILAWVATRRSIPLLPRWGEMTDELRAVRRQYVPMVAGAFLMSSTSLVDQSMAAMLGAGSVAMLSYAGKVVTMILGIGSMALGTAVLPHFSRMVAAEEWVTLRHTFKTYTRLIILLSVPITAILFLFSESVIGLLFERGAFCATDTRLVGQTQAFYLLQIPFYVLGILGVRLISALNSNYILMWGAGINLPLNIVLNYIFMQWIGVAGIALSTTCVYVTSAVMIFVFLYMKLKTR